MKTPTEIKKISIKEFRENGYLQELNRRFLHPLGLALEVKVNDDKTEEISGVWDYREDAEGIFYDVKNSNEKRKVALKRKKEFIDNELKRRNKLRKKLLGFVIEPVE